MNKTIIFALIAAVMGTFRAFGIPAYPKLVPIIVDGDTLYIKIKGDEHYKYAIDKDGITLLQTGNDWYYATMGKYGKSIPSGFKLTADHKKSTALSNYSANHVRI